MRRIADFVHSQGQKVGIQLAHAGRKASTVAPWLVPKRGASLVAEKDVNGWPDNVLGPSAIRWGEGYAQPKEMTQADIRDVIDAFRDAARRSVEAGVDVIELHGAHGYLLCSFLSPQSNTRTDRYGGSFDNRIRFPIEVIKAVRDVIPATMPLLYRISATEWMDRREKHSWTVDDTVAFAKLLPALGVDLLDVSSGGNHRDQQIQMHNDFQVGIAGQIRASLRSAGLPLLLGAVGMITDAEQARDIVEMSAQEEAEQVKSVVGGGKEPKADVVLVARQFMREPEWVLRVAWRLGVDVMWPVQYGRGRFLKGSKI